MEFSKQLLFDTSMLGFLCAFFLLLYFLSWRYSRTKTRLAPEAAGAWPLIGHLHLLGGTNQLPHVTFGKMADKHGPIFSVRLGLHRSLVVSSWEVAKELFTVHDLSISSRPDFIAAKHLSYNGAMFSFSPYGAYWRQLRKITSLELLSARRLELLKHIWLSETKTSIKELYKQWSTSKNSSGHIMVEMKQWFADLTLNIILQMIAGKRYFGAGGGSANGCDEIEEGVARRCHKMIRDFFYFLGLNVAADSFPILGWVRLSSHEKAVKKVAEEMDTILGWWVAEHRQKRSAEGSHEDQDFMDVMLSITKDADLDGFDADTIVKATCMNLIAGGNDTTAGTLTWCISLLLNNPNALKKAQQELDLHVGRERQVNESDITNLVYIQAIVKETLRLYPAAPLSGPRMFTEDCTVHGYHVPKGTRMTLNIWKLQRDPRVWSDDSFEFKPERFIDIEHHRDVDFKSQNFEMLPFGGGRRVCPGSNMALQVINLVLAKLLHGFEISSPSNSLVDMTECDGITNTKVTPLEILISPRLSDCLY